MGNYHLEAAIFSTWAVSNIFLLFLLTRRKGLPVHFLGTQPFTADLPGSPDHRFPKKCCQRRERPFLFARRDRAFSGALGKASVGYELRSGPQPWRARGVQRTGGY